MCVSSGSTCQGQQAGDLPQKLLPLQSASAERGRATSSPPPPCTHHAPCPQPPTCSVEQISPQPLHLYLEDHAPIHILSTLLEVGASVLLLYPVMRDLPKVPVSTESHLVLLRLCWLMVLGQRCHLMAISNLSVTTEQVPTLLTTILPGGDPLCHFWMSWAWIPDRYFTSHVPMTAESRTST